MKEILITSSVLILAILVLRLAFAKKVRRRLLYAAWALVALRLLIPVQIGQMDFSVLTAAKPLTETVTQISGLRVIGHNRQDAHKQVIGEYIEKDQTVFTPEVQEQIQSAIQDDMPREEIAVMIDKVYSEQEIFVPEVQQQVQQQVTEQTDYVSLGQIATIVWLVGVGAMAIWFCAVNLRHSRALRRDAKKLEVSSPIPVFVSEKVGSPCLVGLLRPVIYLTPESAADGETLRHVLTHELTHYAHRDHIWALVRCVCLCIYWFDPLVWVAAYLSRRDCELACDEGALKRLGEDSRIAYGKTLLQVVSHAATPAHLLQTATAMNETKKQLKERVNFIVKKPKFSILAAISMVLICTIVAGCVSTGAGTAAQQSGSDGSTPGSTPATQTSSVPSSTGATEPVASRIDIYGPAWSVPLSVEKQDEISAAWYAENGYALSWEPSVFNLHLGIRYYGTAGDCVVLFEPTMLPALSSITVADYSFLHGSSFVLWTYKDGTLYTLQEAYDNGWITADQVGQIHAYHSSYSLDDAILIYHGIRWEEVEAQQVQFGKRTCSVTAEDDFELETVLVVVYPFANDIAYTADYFANIGSAVLAVEDVTQTLSDSSPTRTLRLTLLNSYKGYLLSAIKNLESREDVYSAQPCHWNSQEDPAELLAQLSEQTQLQIKKDFLAKYKKDDSVAADALSLRVYGVFDGVYALFVDGAFDYSEVERENTVGNLEFRYPSMQALYIYADGEFYSLSTALDAQLISMENLRTVYFNYRAENLHLYE